MLKLATVFSGFGAIEHALKRMGIEYDIVFAGDKGDVDGLSKKIKADMIDIQYELDKLTELIMKIKIKTAEDRLYKEELDSMLNRTLDEYKKMATILIMKIVRLKWVNNNFMIKFEN